VLPVARENIVTRISRLLIGCAAIGAAYVLATPAAHADMILGYQLTGPGTTTGSGTVNMPAQPGSTFYGDTFTAPTTTISGSTFGFYDDFVFQVATGTVDSLTTSINLGTLLAINDLQVRIYSLAGNSPPVLGTPAGGAIDGWSTAINYAPGLTGMQALFQPTTLQAGTYVLEIRGNVTGANGGSYSGVLNLAPVPVPAALPLLLSGIGLLGAAAGRRRMPA
jgi:hypothetical protein